MAMAVGPHQDFETFHAYVGSAKKDFVSNPKAPLQDLCISEAQNAQRIPSSASTVDTLTTELSRLSISEPCQVTKFDRKVQRVDNGLNRTFDRASQHQSFKDRADAPGSASGQNNQGPRSVRTEAQNKRLYYIDLPVGDYANHPIALAAHHNFSPEEQVGKHRRGDFEWLLSISVPHRQSESSREGCEPTTGRHEPIKHYFGSNILPRVDRELACNPSNTYVLLVTPIDGDADLEEAIARADKQDMALSHPMMAQSQTPAKVLNHDPTPGSASALSENVDSLDVIASSSTRAEDSIEALDRMEEQLEEFNVAAQVKRVISPDLKQIKPSPPTQTMSRDAAGTSRTPQPKRNGPAPGALTVRARAKDPRGSPGVQRSGSMIFLDSPKLKEEDKALLRAPPKKVAAKGVASLLPPKPCARSTKQPTVPSFELPGEAVSRRLKEKREARLSMQLIPDQAPQITATSTIRRTKSAKPPTRPTFELPGEAISRRKKEELDARLREQQEELRKRREFKAKPLPSSAANNLPRETVASRARRAMGENQTTSTPIKSLKQTGAARQPLANANNQMPQRGRELAAEEAKGSPGYGRTASSSNGSINSKRNSISLEDMQHQRVRGREIYERDNCFVQDRQKDKRTREEMARIAREQAAERSRLQSREWAEKQKRRAQRVTMGSLLSPKA